MKRQQPTIRVSASRGLSAEETEAFGKELDALRSEIVASLGDADARYVRRLRDAVRWSATGGRVLLVGGLFPPAWLAGTALLGVSKILENMELGHNVMHGQYDFMNDLEFSSQTYEWDTACPASAWRHSHNYKHHTFTNVRGQDRDLGYGLLRLFPEQRWQPLFVIQPLYALALAIFFEWGIAVHDLELDVILHRKKTVRSTLPQAKELARKTTRQLLKDYVVFPALAGPFFAPVVLGNLTANLARNLWAFSVIFCGHFAGEVETFSEDVLAEETRAGWYLRQLKGSSNLEGGPLFDVFTGNLSHQIEHHLFPDLPAHRYVEMAPEVKRIAAKYGQHYETGSFRRQIRSVAGRIFRQSLPPSRATLRVSS